MNKPYELPRRTDLRPFIAAASLLASGLVSLAAQSPTSGPAHADNDEVIELSPFVVNTQRDVGYTATSTLGGTRTNTELKDLANPLDVFTPELMQDLGIQDIQNLTNFASGVEPNAAGDMNADGQEREVWNYNYMQIRGFKVGTVTRNFMALNAQFEAYNSERVEFSKGPNAILAGMGDPGGSVNFSTKLPKLRSDSYSLTHRTDDLGSQRTSLDVNQVLIKDKLGLRLNALREDEEFYRHPSYERQDAWHLTAQWRPTPKTIINAGYENRRSNRASPRGVFALDYVTAWRNAGSKVATAVPANNSVTVDGARVTAASVGMATINSNTWVLDSYGQIWNTRGSARGADSFVNSQRLDTAATGLDFPRDVWIGGANGINDSDWRITELSLSHSVADDFSLELSYGHADNHVLQGNSVSRNLYVDTTGFGANAHPGELFVETRPFWIDRDFAIDHYRGTAAYTLDLTKVNKWLGTHQLAAVYEYNLRHEWQNNGRLSLTRTPTGALTGAPTPFWIRDYLSPAAGVFAQRDLRSSYYSKGIDQNGYIAEFLPTEGYAFYRWRVEQDTLLGVLQSRWFNNRLITTIGLRKDDVTKYVASTYQEAGTNLWRAGTVDAPAGTHPSSAPFINPPRVDAGISRNFGAVVHATPWLSFTANYATNVAPGSESRGISGDYLPQSSGESLDYGIRLNLLDDRLNLTLVKFKTSQKQAAAQNTAINSPIDDLQAIETILYENAITATNRLGISGDYTTTDRDADGEELTITANPSRHWTLRLAASRLVNRQTNIAPDVRAYYTANLAYYEQQNPALTTSGGTTTLGTYLSQAKNAYALMNTRENVESFPSSEYNVRFTAKYTFDTASWMKGLFVGGSARWASAPVIGYYRKLNSAGSPYYDPSLPVRGDDPAYLDLFVGYQRRLPRNLTWKVQVNISNVFDTDDPVPYRAVNSADAADFRWVSYGYRPIDGRIISLTNTISF